MSAERELFSEQIVEIRVEFSVSNFGGVEQFERTRSGVARVGEGLFASVGSLGIESFEYGERHKYLASYLEPTGIIAY